MPDSILRCTVKKSVHVTERLVLAVSAVIVGIAIVVLAYYGIAGLYSVLMPILMNWIRYIGDALSTTPLWGYVILAVPASIVGYSLCWCVARELDTDDWESDASKIFALVLVFVFALVLAFAFALAFLVFVLAFAFALTLALAILAFAFALTLALAFVLAFVFALARADEPIGGGPRWYYIFRSPGAVWNHYRKVKKNA